MDHAEALGGPGQRHVQGAQAPGRLAGDDPRLDHHHRVELEAVGGVGGQQHQRLEQPALAHVPGIDHREAGGGQRLGQRGQQRLGGEDGHPARGRPRPPPRRPPRPPCGPGPSTVAPSRDPRRPGTAIILGSTPVRRTGRGGVSSGAATASTWLATASTSAGVR